MISFHPRQFSAPQPSGATNLDSFGPEIHRGLDGFLHRPPERNTPFELHGHVLSDQLGVQFGGLNLHDINVNLLAGHLAQPLFELVDFRAFAANHDARTGRQNGDPTAGGGALNQNPRHRSRLQLLLQHIADLAVFIEKFAEFLLLSIPLGAPVMSDRDSQTNWISFLTHKIYSSDNTILIWQLRFKI